MSDFREWFKENLSDYASDIAEHGADCGFPYMTYTTECAELHDRFEDEIWEMLNEDAEQLGLDNCMALVATFTRSDMANDMAQLKNLLWWYACERLAQESDWDESEGECETCHGLGTVDRKECVGLPGSFRSVKPCPDCEAPK